MIDDMEFGPWDGAERKALNAYKLYENGEMKKALAELDTALEINPANSAWHFNRGLTLDGLERFDDAICEYKTALELSPEDLETLNSLAVDYTRISHYDLALEIFEQIECIDPKFEPSYCNRIITYTEIGKHELAEQMFYMAQEINPECPLCYYNIGNSLFGRQKYEKAIWCWEKTALLEPEHPQINYRIAQAHWANGNYTSAHLHFLQELRNNPGDIDVILDFGLFLLETDKLYMAKEKFHRILELRPNFAPAMHYLGEIAFVMDRYAEAAKWLTKAMKADRKLSGPRFRLAQCELIADRQAKAIEYLMDEMDLNPDDIDILLSMASMFLYLGRLDYASHCLLKITDNDETNAKAFYYLGLAQAIRGGYDDASSFFEHAISLEPNNLRLLRDCGLAYLKMGDLAMAKEMIESACSVNADDPDTLSVYRRIKRAILWQKVTDLLAKISLGCRKK